MNYKDCKTYGRAKKIPVPNFWKKLVRNNKFRIGFTIVCLSTPGTNWLIYFLSINKDFFIRYN